MRRVRLHVSRTAVSVEDPAGWREPTRALVALTIEAGRVGIVGVGEDEAELVERLARPPEIAARGIRAKIAAAAAAALPKRPEPKIVRPGDDPYWDRTWQDSRVLRAADPAHAGEVLLIAPLDERSWSPHLVRGLLMYVLWTSPATRDKLWPEFRRPHIELRPSDDLAGLHYEELVDQLRDLWGENRVILPDTRPVSPLPVTRLARTAKIAHAVFWLALAISLLLSRAGRPTVPALIAATIALFALLLWRRAKAHARAELPRRHR